MQVVAQINVVLTDDGQANLKANGPAAGNQILLLGLLEFAKGILQAQVQRPTSPIVQAKGALPIVARNGG